MVSRILNPDFSSQIRDILFVLKIWDWDFVKPCNEQFYIWDKIENLDFQASIYLKSFFITLRDKTCTRTDMRTNSTFARSPLKLV